MRQITWIYVDGKSFLSQGARIILVVLVSNYVQEKLKSFVLSALVQLELFFREFPVESWMQLDKQLGIQI